MNEKLEKLISKAKSTKLSVEEKSIMLNNIGSFIKHKKLHDKQSEVPSPYAIHSPYFSMSTFVNFAHRKYIPLAIIILLILGTTGASAAANNALPGDALYPIKINVNEKVESLLAVGTKAKAEIHLKQAERRIAEAEQLSAKNKLTTEVKDKIKSDFINRASDLDNELDNLSKNGDGKSAKDISKRFESKLIDHASKFNNESDGDFKDFLKLKSDSTHMKYNSENEDSNQSINNGDNESDSKNTNEKNKKESGGLKIKNNSHQNGDDGESDDNENGDDGEDGGPIINPTPLPPVSSNSTFTLADVAKHNNSSSCYTAINGSVYDVTGFISQHPGGSGAIISLCGKDGSSAFDGQHGGQSRPASELASFKIGTLK